jgi:hypothetical protein
MWCGQLFDYGTNFIDSIARHRSVKLRLTAACAGAALLSMPAVAHDMQGDVGSPGFALCQAMVSCDAWKAFRKQHPSPYQAFAVKIDADGSAATVVFSEPPPWVSLDALQAKVREVFDNRVVEVGRLATQTGLDGWLSDLVFRVRLVKAEKTDVVAGETLGPRPIPLDLAEPLRELHALVYGTTDGFWLDDIGAPIPMKPVPDLRIGRRSLAAWFADGAAAWTALDGSPTLATTAALFQTPKPSTYGRADGLVVLALPKGVALKDTEVPFRRFAVASDILLGAVRSGSGTLLLVGRARALPFAALPPLRWETFAMFARNADEELYQSYERRRIFAGKIGNGEHKGWDWAPILLSPQLDDSEFGTLLNQADQILKSWSQHGDVQYRTFDYPAPGAYPFDKPASDVFAEKLKTTSLVFNWNTSDFGMLVQSGTTQTLSADRTAALPILYLPGGSDLLPADLLRSAGEAYADEARERFAAQGDPILARVAQNVLLGQAARHMLAVSDPRARVGEARSDRTAVVLDREAQAWLTRVLNGSEPIAPEAKLILANAQKSSGLTPAQFASFIAVPQRMERGYLALNDRLKRIAMQGRAAESARSAAEDDLDAQGIPLQKRACQESGGTVKTDACHWVGTAAESAAKKSDYEARVTRYLAPFKGRIASATAGIKAANDAGKPMMSERDRLVALSKDFERLSAILNAADGSARLDRILPAVLAANQTKPSTGWIQTPSVVLSQNRTNVEAIGGHNVRLTPSRATLRSDSQLVVTEVNGEKLAANGKQQLAAQEAAPPLRTNSLGAGDGTLFDLLKPRASVIAPDGSLGARLLAKRQCAECTGSYVIDDGTIYKISAKPPPLAITTVPGKAVMTNEIVEAGRASTQGSVELVGFPDKVVTDVSELVERMKRPPGGGRFQPPDPAGRSSGKGSVLLVADRDRKIATLRVDGPDGLVRAIFDEPVAIAGARVETPASEAVRAEFGEAIANADASVVITLGGAPESRARIAVGVSGGGDKATLAGRLAAVVNAWLPKRSAAPLAQHLVSLRAMLRETLGDRTYTYFVTNQGGRATIVARPSGARRG